MKTNETANPPHAHSTPIKLDISTTLPFTTTQRYRVESCSAMADEIRKYLIGPMPSSDFLDEFFPESKLPGLLEVPMFTSGCYDKVVKAKNEKNAYMPFIQATKKFTPDLHIVNSSSFPDCNPRSNFPFQIKPDVTIYPKFAEKTNSALAEIFIEFKWKSSDDPFCCTGGDGSFPSTTKTARDTLGQITSYAAVQFGAQFRTHLYSIFICQDTARILRWDRSGTIVTEAIKYNESPFLADFFRRYTKAPPAMRGIDTSVFEPTTSDLSDVRKVLAWDRDIPLFKLSIPVACGLPRFFIVRSPIATPYTPPGRATRGFVAYDLLGKAFVYLKDSWRIDLPDITAEGLVYATLEKASVSNIARCIVAGDISDHVTKTQEYASKPWVKDHDNKAHFIPHRHYRLVLNVIGRSLMEYKSSYEMTTAVRDALVAHRDAHNAQILHRDLSPGNIIIDSNGRGLLIDWDLSKPVLGISETPRRATRTGTWQFMSNALINNQTAPHTFVDDLESTVYILMWMTLVYSSINQPAQAKLFLSNTLDPQPVQGQGGLAKSDFLIGRSFLTQYSFPKRDALHNLIDKLADMLSVRYSTVTAEDGEIHKLLKKMVDHDPSSVELRQAYEQSKEHAKERKCAQLQSHDAAIKLFDIALKDASEWPTNDAAEKQDFAFPKLNASVTEKTNFDASATLVLEMSVEETERDMVESDHDTESDCDTVRNLFGSIDKPHGLQSLDEGLEHEDDNTDSMHDEMDDMDF